MTATQQPNPGKCLPNLMTLGISDMKARQVSSMRGDLNPLVNLADNKCPDYLDIVDFVPLLFADTEERVISSNEGSELVMKTGPRKPKLEKVTQMQWTAASSRILAKLILDGKVGLDAVAHYLAYTVKVSSLAQRYVWTSVLMYDREYRKAQAIYNFPWGSDVPHLVSVHLVPRTDKSTSAAKATPSAGREQLPYACNLYNASGTCQYGSNCRFQHHCSKCKGSHPASQHPSE